MGCKKMVVHCQKQKYDVYIGRGKDPITGQFSVFGNPFKIFKDGTRAEVIEKYEQYLKERMKTDNDFKKAVKSLRGKVLGCWCSPLQCHGDVLVKYANEE